MTAAEGRGEGMYGLVTGWGKHLAWRHETRDVAVFRGLRYVLLGGVTVIITQRSFHLG